MNPYQVHAVPPTDYLIRHHDSLLPGWPTPPDQLLLVFFQAQYSLLGSGLKIEIEKERLWQEFQSWTQQVQELALAQSLQFEGICPKSGYPLRSQPGSQRFDLVAIAVATLGFLTTEEGGCRLLKHPHWHHACYPSLVLLWGDGMGLKFLTEQVRSKSRGIIGDCRFNPI